MNIAQFFRIVWAYKTLIFISAALCFAAGLTFVEVVKPRYEAQSRVMLDVIKPDPVTGEVIGSAFLRAYTKTQTEMVKSQQVARMVVKDLQWDKEPAMQRAFRENGNGADFATWASERVIAGANADLIQGSNILEITYSSSSPSEAKRVADGLLKAYQDMTLQTRRETATRNAEWYEAQAEKTKATLFAAETEKTNYERENGIILQDDKVDIDSARLAALATQGSAPIMTAPSGGVTPAESQLASLDSEIAEQTKVLGPNHPMLQQLKARRVIMAQQAAQERSSSSMSVGAAMSAARASSGMLEAQKAKVMGQREKVERLRLMQGDIDLRRDQYNRAVARAAQLRQEAEATEAGVTPLASATTPDSPAFPKKGMILGVSIPAGLVLGLVIGLVLELVGRRVRSAEDLSVAIAAPVLAVIRDPSRKKAGAGPGLLGRVRALVPGRTARVARA